MNTALKNLPNSYSGDVRTLRSNITEPLSAKRNILFIESEREKDNLIFRKLFKSFKNSSKNYNAEVKPALNGDNCDDYDAVVFLHDGSEIPTTLSEKFGRKAIAIPRPNEKFNEEQLMVSALEQFMYCTPTSLGQMTPGILTALMNRKLGVGFANGNPIISDGIFEIDTQRDTVRLCNSIGETVKLRPRECVILAELLEKRGQIVSRDTLNSLSRKSLLTSDHEDKIQSRTSDIHVNRIRQRLIDLLDDNGYDSSSVHQYLHAVYGEGYTIPANFEFSLKVVHSVPRQDALP